MDIERKLLKIINKQQGETMAFELKKIPVSLKENKKLRNAIDVLLEAYDKAIKIIKE